MTVRGLLALGLFALLLLSALATGFSEIFIGAFMAGFLIAFAMISTLAGVFLVRARQYSSAPAVVRGEAVGLEVVFRGPVLLPVVAQVTLGFPGERPHVVACPLFGFRHPAVRCELPCPHRGLWAVGVVSMRCGDLFGFFTLPVPRRRLPEPLPALTVYPELHPIAGCPPAPAPSLDDSEKNPVVSDQGDSFSDTRVYRSGDPLKRIHWKLSIRTGQLHTRQYERSVDRMVWLLLDNAVVAGEAPETALAYADLSSECAAALLYYYLFAGHAVTLDYHGGRLTVRSGDDFDEAYALLASLPFREPSSAADRVEASLPLLGRISGYHVITRAPAPELLDALTPVPSPQCPASLLYPAGSGEAWEIEPLHPAVQAGLRLTPLTAVPELADRMEERL